MLPLWLRTLISIAVIAGGIFMLYTGDYLLGGLSLAAAAFFIYGYISGGTVTIAYMAVSRGDIDKAEKLLKQTRFPHLLNKRQKGYFHFVQAFVLLDRKETKNAETALKLALNYKLRTESDQALVLSVLTRLELDRKDKRKAKEYLGTAKKLKANQFVAAEIKKLEKLV